MTTPAIPLLLWMLAACGPHTDSADPADTGDPVPSLTLLEDHTVALGAFGRVLPRSDGFDLGLVTVDNEHHLLSFDEAWQPTGGDLRLSEQGPREPDMTLSQGEQGLFHSRLTKDDTGPGIELRTLDPEATVVATSGHLLQHDDERALDATVLVTADRAWLGTEYRQDGEHWQDNIAPQPELERGLLIRELSLELDLLATHRLTATIPSATPDGQFWGLGAAQLRDDRAHWVFAAAASGGDDYFDAGESAGARRIWALEYDLDLQFVQAHGPLTPENQDSYWCTGVVRVGDLLLISYTFRRPADGPVMGPPTPDGGNIGLLLATGEFEVLEHLELSDHTSDDLAEGKGAHRSSIRAQEETFWVSWDDREGIHVQAVEVKGQ